MNITVYTANRWNNNVFQQTLTDHTITYVDKPLQQAGVDTAEGSEAICIFIDTTITEDDLEQLPNLDLICTMSTGYDHIDVDACEEHDVTVCNVPSYGQNTVAEHTFALLLTISRKLYSSIKHTEVNHDFDRDASIRGFDLAGKTMGVIGCGDIGRHTARMAKGFNMDVVAYDVYEDPSCAERIGFEYTDLDTIFEEADIISLHVPLNDATDHLIDHDAIDNMQEETILLNTSRGEIVDTEALLQGLNDGTIKAAGLDVLEHESTLGHTEAVKTMHEDVLRQHVYNHALISRDDVIVTPHNAFNSVEALERIASTTAENITAYATGEPQNTVNA